MTRDATDGAQDLARCVLDAHAELVRQWTDAQRDFWRGWLAIASAANTEALEDAAAHLVRSQGEWARAWMAATAATRGGG